MKNHILLLKYKFFICVIVLFSEQIFSQNPNLYKNNLTADSLFNTNHLQNERSDFSMLTGGVGHSLSSPFRWNSNDLLIFGGFAAVTAGSFLLDDEVKNAMPTKSKVYDDLAEVGYSYGSPTYAIPAAAVFYLSGLAADNYWLRETGLMLSESLITLAIIQIPSRIIAGRSRPMTGEKNTSFKLFGGIEQSRSSFISGHSAIAFAFSTILSEQIDNIWATIGLYTLATLTPLSRLYEERHWFSDNVIGITMGYFMAKTIINFHKENKVEGKVLLVPSINSVSLVYNF